MHLEELFIILLSDIPSEEIKNNESKIVELIPELKKCIGFDQKNPWHIYDVYEHTLHVVDGTEPILIVRLAALFHDMGKPAAFKIDDAGIGHFHGHWEISKQIFLNFASKYHLDSNVTEMVSNLIFYHDLNFAKLDDEVIKKIISLLGIDGINMLYDLKKSDLLAHAEEKHFMLKDYEKQKEHILELIKEKD